MARKDEGLALLQRILGGAAISSLGADIYDLLHDRKTPEGLHLEYKRGAIFAKSERGAAAELLQQIAGFANAEGGVLVVGAADGKDTSDGITWDFDGCPDIGKATPDEWTTNVVNRELAAYLAPAPRIGVAVNGGKRVLVVAVPQTASRRLIPLVEPGRKTGFYLRVGPTTVRIDDYLVADLLLGRRTRPELSLHADVTLEQATEREWRLQLALRLENTGIGWCPEARIACYAFRAQGGREQDWASPIAAWNLPSSLRQALDLPVPAELPRTVQFAEISANKSDDSQATKALPPYTEERFSYRVLLPPERGSYLRWSAAFVALPHDQPPYWWQLEAFIDFSRFPPQLEGKRGATRIESGQVPIAYERFTNYEQWAVAADILRPEDGQNS